MPFLILLFPRTKPLYISGVTKLNHILAGLCFAFGAALLQGIEILPPGHRPEPPGVHALVGGTIITRPGERLEGGVVIIRDGRIEQVGSDLAIPADARRWEMQGTFIYAGFIDPYLTIKPRSPMALDAGLDHDHSPRASDIGFFGTPGQEKDPGTPGPGYGLTDVTPEKRVAETYANDSKNLEALRELGFTAGAVVPEKGIVRGTSAFVLLHEENPTRTILKADTFQHIVLEQVAAADERYPNSLMGEIAVVRQAMLDAQHYSRSRSFPVKQDDASNSTEFNLALEALVPVVQGKMPVTIEPGSILMVDRMARIARELDLQFQMVASGQEWRRPELAATAGVPFIVPLAFPEVPKLPEEDDWTAVSLDQLRSWDWAPENPALLRRQKLEVALTSYGLTDRKNFRKNLRLAVERGFSELDATAALTTVPAKMCGLEKQLGTIEAGKLANLTVVEGNYFAPTNKVREVWVRGKVYRVQPGAKSDPVVKRPEQARDEQQARVEQEEKKREEGKEGKKRELMSERTAKSPQDGRGAIVSPKVVLVKKATIWTSGEQGKLEGADMLVEEGKIMKIGKDLETPEGAHVIDAQGRHVTPGLIDCHSHAMILGGVNEGTLPSSAMVRVSDVVNSETRRIVEELAGGLTTANLLHGSANPIGGQNCVIKLREGASPEEMKFAEAPPGIKFALGENVKQSNWGERNVTRFPQTRMGVRTFMANRFTAAQRYLEDLKKTSQSETNVPPRRDLELETIGEILEGKRLIHCHSYRQDEILTFLRLMEFFGVKVATLQHVLEGYKVADEIAKHGAGASCFTDWWGYKYEVIDAIPYAGSLMRDRGVVVSFNSDSGDLSRRLYLEAAKAVKYGGTPEEEALKFVTINPAKQLRIDRYVGSLETGKHADFVLWSHSPLDSQTVCLETWIDGRKYFDRSKVADVVESLREERELLLKKAQAVAGLSKPEEANDKAKAAFFQLPLELLYENVDRHCDAQ